MVVVLHIPGGGVGVGLIAVGGHGPELPAALVQHRASAVDVPVAEDLEAVVGIAVEAAAPCCCGVPPWDTGMACFLKGGVKSAGLW